MADRMIELGDFDLVDFSKPRSEWEKDLERVAGAITHATTRILHHQMQEALISVDAEIRAKHLRRRPEDVR